MKNADMPAMPVSGADGLPIDVFSLTNDLGANLISSGMTTGLTKREMMVMHFSAALISNPRWDGMTPKDIAILAVDQADATLKALEK
ncbi:hypothetical protein [Aeromonas dhakensis]|uniref:hypothetical protein n=1 Tax=Aeromonas dhakensis TaxID=196024 RepID=UPI001C5A9130|nr:hypothetical protein [Aeromonas dhakensis]MBW3691705.1 hypothetical protein [Aeromonas dhakensis]